MFRGWSNLCLYGFSSIASIRSFLRCMISTKSNLFNNFVILIMFKIFYVHFYRPMAIFVVCYTSLVVSVTIFTQ